MYIRATDIYMRMSKIMLKERIVKESDENSAKVKYVHCSGHKVLFS